MVLAYNPNVGGGLASGVEKLANAYLERNRRQGIMSGLKQINEGDWEGGINTIAEKDPDTALGLAQYKKKADDAMALQQAKLEAKNTLTPYQQEMLALKRQELEKKSEIPNIANMPEGVQLTGNKAYDSVILKNAAERDINYQKALDEANSFNATADRLVELLPKAQLDTLLRRKTPTMLFDEDVQKARQEINNILGGLRLDQMQYLKGAISDKEQEFLSNVVSGDITKYTPAEIKGTLNSIKRRLGDEVARYAPKTSQSDYKSKYGLE